MIWVAKNLYFLIVYLTGRTPVQNEKERRLSFLRGVYTRVYKNGALFLKEAVHTGV